MKTPIEKLIDYLDKYNEVFGMVGLSIRDRASILLEEEKEIYKKQYHEGYKAGCLDSEVNKQ